jgi:DNA topoisomerase I
VLLNTPKAERAKRKALEPVKEFGPLEGADGPVKVMSGRFGPYVTDGTTNATIPKTLSPESLTPEMAIELLQKKKAAGPSNGKRFVRRAKGKSKAKK